MSLGLDILKELVIEYQTNNDQITFSKILKRVDKLLLLTIHKHVKRRGLLRIDLRDLYHSAIVGLSRAAKTSPKNEQPEKIIARIIAYVRLEIDNDFWKKHRPSDSKKISLEMCKRAQNDSDIFKSIEFSFLLRSLNIMEQQSLIIYEDMICFLKRHMYNAGYKEIGDYLGITRDGARKRMMETEKKIQAWIHRDERC